MLSGSMIFHCSADTRAAVARFCPTLMLSGRWSQQLHLWQHWDRWACKGAPRLDRARCSRMSMVGLYNARNSLLRVLCTDRDGHCVIGSDSSVTNVDCLSYPRALFPLSGQWRSTYAAGRRDGLSWSISSFPEITVFVTVPWRLCALT